MKPLGLKPWHNKTDHRLHDHKHHRIRNWWEAEQEPNKAMAKREAKKEIEIEVSLEYK